MSRLFSFRPGIELRGRKFKGMRGWAGKPFHPPLTDVVVGAYTLAFVFDLLSYLLHTGFLIEDEAVSRNLFTAGTYAFITGAFAAIPTIITGFWDWWKGLERDRTSGWLGKAKRTQAWRTINAHAVLMLLTLALAGFNVAMRSGSDYTYTDLPLLVFTAIVLGVLALGATYGGSVVYDYGFNVETAGDHPVWHESERDVLPGEDHTIG